MVTLTGMFIEKLCYSYMFTKKVIDSYYLCWKLYCVIYGNMITSDRQLTTFKTCVYLI